MKNLFVFFVLIYLMSPVFAGSINPALYSTMQRQSYRNNYNRQINNRPMPYWQAQSNYMTRNRYYSDYKSYTNYSNSIRQYNSDFYRGRF